MNEFDFDEDQDACEKLSPKKCSSPSHSNSSISGTSISGPLRGRTKNRKMILSGAHAIKEGQEKRRIAEQEAAAAAAVKAAASAKNNKKRAKASSSTPSSDNIVEQKKPQNSSPEKKVVIAKGRRRHKHSKTERNNSSNDAGADAEDFFPPASQSSDSKSVRFAEGANGKRKNNPVEYETNSSSGRSSNSSPSRRKERPSSCLKTKTTYPPSSPQRKAKSTKETTPPTSPGSQSSVSYSSFAKIHGNGARKKRHKPRRFQLGYSPNASSLQQESSVYSSSPSSTSKSPDKTQVVTLGRPVGYSSRDFDTTPDAASAAQNVGNYRMLIDELSYLCSAILQCRQQQRHRIGLAKAEAICKHNSITAGAACDIGELISQLDTRTALLMLSSSSGRNHQGEYKNGAKSVGALGAILEVMACVPPVFDWSDVCKEVIIGAEVNGSKPASLIGPNSSGFDLDNINLAAVAMASQAEKTKFDVVASKALSVVSLFVGIDCTGSSRAAVTPSSKIERNVVKGALNSVLQHQQSLRGIARLVSDDPVVNTYLRSMVRNKSHSIAGTSGAGEIKLFDDHFDEGSIASKSSRSSTLSSLSMSKTSSQQTVDEQAEAQIKNVDPTKAGRHRGRKRKKLMAIREDEVEKDSEIALSPPSKKSSDQSQVKSALLSGSGKSNCLDFASESDATKPTAFASKVRLNSVEKYTEKLSLALSRAKLPQLDLNLTESDESDDSSESTCQHCKIWGMDTMTPQSCPSKACFTSSSLAIDAAECIITGKDSSSGDDADADMHDDDGDSDDDDFLGDQNAANDDIASKNPILFANEMLRKSGSLPDYSRAYASTLAAILLAYKPNTGDKSEARAIPCRKCISYLQRRASSLSGIIDSLCCLSPKVSVVLSCPETFLIPGLLKLIGDLSFGDLGTATNSAREEVLTSLKTLTSLTHENSVACEQLVTPFHWEYSLPISANDVMVESDKTTSATGVSIIFTHLLNTVSKQHRKPITTHDEDDGNKSNEKYSYDTTIFCLNILTNIIETAPQTAKHMIENIVITNEEMDAISWLTRWVVSTTSGFQKSVMKGSFGSDDKEHSSDGDELQAGEEGNLVTAGNGFVLLAYLMLEDETSSSSSLSIRDKVVKELPIDESGASGGIQYMIKTLKAFCNFYHYSVGDLSVAVIAPIVKLISGLEKLDVQIEQRKSWL
jgi:hypothetical protein